MMFKENLLSIKQDLGKYHRDKEELLKYYITKRLNKSLNSYYKELKESYNYLQKKDKENLKILKKLNKDD